MEKNYKPGFTYQEFAPQFTTEFYEPDAWAKLFSKAGAKYVVLTSKHHEGYTNWPSKVSWNWNSMDVGPKRDLVGELANSIRTKTPDIKFGLYHSLYEWFNPLYTADRASGFETDNFVRTKTMPELYDLVMTYKPEVVWSDGEWEASPTYWKSTEFLAWLFNDSPVKDTVVVNDRWGTDCLCKHGSYYTCSDRYNPGVLQEHKWENAMTLDQFSWGYRRDAQISEYLTIEKLLQTMAETVSCGGNLLVNVGPTKEGTIPVIMQERLIQMGEWLDINGEAIYATRPWTAQNDSLAANTWYTSTNEAVYALLVDWPVDGTVTLGSVAASSSASATLLGDPQERPLELTTTPHGTTVQLPPMDSLCAKWVYVVRFLGL